MEKKNIFGLILIALMILFTVLYLMTNHSKNEALNKIKKLEEVNMMLRKDNENQVKEIKRLDENLIDSEEKKVRERAEKFVDALYTTSPETDDKKRYERLKIYADENLINQYYGPKRTSPIYYDTSIKDLYFYTEKFSTLNNQYKVIVTGNMNVKDPSGEMVSDKRIASELLFTYKNNNWYVTDFKQFDLVENKK